MIDYPKMLPEVIEAITTYFDDDKDTMVDCLMYLKNALARESDVITICQWFDDNRICEYCGYALETQTIKEPHTECGPGVYEILYETYCPNCDFDRGE